MDPNQLLNTSTPFDQNKLNLLDQVVNALYTTKNPQERQMANTLIDQFQKLENSFQYCEFILNNTNSNYTRYIALSIYETFINEKWNLLDNNSKLNLRNFLVSLLIKLVMNKDFYANTANHFLINKLNVVIVIIAKNEWTTTWPNFISELCTSSKSDPNLCENNMKLLILLSEEINSFWKNSLTAKKAYEFGIDAIIVQDLGLARKLIECFPDLPIHASTQMTIHNLEGVLEAEKLGFKRVVLSRELSLSEIKYICDNSNIEIEVFIHGAICICYSGQCLLSSMIGARSGNRGKCAQPCRLPYELLRDSDTVDKGYLLSTRDLCSLEVLPELVKAGITSFKIEGRLKTPEYVSTVTRIYRKYIDLALSSKPYSIDYTDTKALMQVFNRGGFSSGHLTDEYNSELVYPKKPNNMGLYLGRVQKFNPDKGHITLSSKETLSIGDTVSLENETGTYTISELMLGNSNIEESSPFQPVTIGRMKGNINVGDKVYKMSNKELTRIALDTVNKESKKIHFNCLVTLKLNQPISMSVASVIEDPDSIYSDIYFTISTDGVPIPALNAPLTEDRVIAQISKTKNTPFEFDNIKVEMDNNIFLPSISYLNELRRLAIEKIETVAKNRYCRELEHELPSVWN